MALKQYPYAAENEYRFMRNAITRTQFHRFFLIVSYQINKVSTTLNDQDEKCQLYLKVLVPKNTAVNAKYGY